MRFKSLTNEPVRIALLSGHVTVVDVEFKELHARFHRDAYALGCVSEDMLKGQAAAAMPEKMAEHIVRKATKMQRLAEVIADWVDTNKLDNFSKSTGKPDARLLSDAVGENVSSAERDEVWYKHQEDKEVS